MNRTIHEAAVLIRKGELTPTDLLEECLARVDRFEEKVRAWVFVDRDRAREDAERLTQELKAGQYRGPLHGIPIGVKDIFDVFDWPTAAGSKLWANAIARRDATVVGRLRQAGAVLMGKTVTTAFASFDPPVTRNPWGLSRTPGGSSSGSAAAMACGMCLGALASQTGGSTTRPAAYCGVCSLKPTYGRVSLDGVVPLAPSMDHVGLMANCVRDLAMLFEATAGPDGRNGFQFNHHVPIPNCIRAIDGALEVGGDKPDLGFMGGMFATMADPSVLKQFQLVADILGKEGAWVEQVVPPAGFTDALRQHRIIMAVEAAAFHRDRLHRHPADYPSKVRALIEEGLACSAVDYREARLHRDELRDQVNRMINGQRFLVTPATTAPAPDSATTGDPAFNSPWSFTGQPTVSLPCGWSPEGLPMALQLVSYDASEDELLATAAWTERAVRFDGSEVPIR